MRLLFNSWLACKRFGWSSTNQFTLLLQTNSPTNRLMKIVRLFTGTDNESHFEDIEVELNPVGHMQASALQAAAHGVMFRSAPATHLSPHHPAPRRQYVITLSGQVEIETGDGTIRRFGAGDVMLAEDTTGRGHITRVVGGQPRHYVFIPLK
jgi:uncharacterized cupin superfamily protein